MKARRNPTAAWAAAAWIAFVLLPFPASAIDGGVAEPREIVRYERPPAGTLESGAIGVPEWAVIVVGALAIAGSAAALIVAARRGRRSAR